MVRSYLAYFAVRVAEVIVSILPGSYTWPIFRQLAIRKSHKNNDQTRIVRANMNRVSGRKLSEGELDGLVEKAFVSYAEYWHRTLRLSRKDSSELGKNATLENFHLFKQALESDRGVILALPHTGNWDLASVWLEHLNISISVVVEILKPPAMFRWFTKRREARGHHVIGLDENTASHLAVLLKDKQLIGLVGDRDLNNDGVEVEFFGEKTTMPGGPVLLAARSGAVLLPTATYYSAAEGFGVCFGEPIEIERSKSIREDVKQYTQELAKCYESFIRRAPEQWHVFQPNWPSDRD